MNGSAGFLAEEFWWLKALERPLEGYVGVARSWWTPYPETPGWREYPDRINLQELSNWASKSNWENGHRTLAVYVNDRESTGIVGPFLIDSDCDEELAGPDGTLHPPQLAKAQQLAISVANRYLDQGIPEQDLRAYFSWHKGFHLELFMRNRPAFHTIGANNTDGGAWRSEREKLRAEFGTETSPAIDRPHLHVRLKRSWNVWTAKACVVRLAIQALGTMTISEIQVKARLSALE